MIMFLVWNNSSVTPVSVVCFNSLSRWRLPGALTLSLSLQTRWWMASQCNETFPCWLCAATRNLHDSLPDLIYVTSWFSHLHEDISHKAKEQRNKCQCTDQHFCLFWKSLCCYHIESIDLCHLDMLFKIASNSKTALFTSLEERPGVLFWNIVKGMFSPFHFVSLDLIVVRNLVFCSSLVLTAAYAVFYHFR